MCRTSTFDKVALTINEFDFYFFDRANWYSVIYREYYMSARRSSSVDHDKFLAREDKIRYL